MPKKEDRKNAKRLAIAALSAVDGDALQTYIDENAALSAENADLRAQVADLILDERVIKEAVDSNEKLRARVAFLENKNRILIAEKSSLVVERDALLADVAELEGDINEIVNAVPPPTPTLISRSPNAADVVIPKKVKNK